jgi:hypothetical protein
MKYYLIQNDTISDGPRDLPINWKNISNFYLLDDVTLSQYGWIPAVNVTVGSGSISDSSTLTISGSSAGIIQLDNDNCMVVTAITGSKTGMADITGEVGSIANNTQDLTGCTVVQTTVLRDQTDDEISSITSQQWNDIRAQRNMLIQQCDWYTFSDCWAQLTSDQQTSWATYRQALRDIPQNNTDPTNISWPTIPWVGGLTSGSDVAQPVNPFSPPVRM